MKLQFRNKRIVIVVGVLCIVNIVIAYGIWSIRPRANPEIYFFDVGQGDSQMIVLPGDVRILIDGGAPGKLLRPVSRVMPFFSRRIDIVMFTHPQMDHFGGLIDIVKRYDVGVILWTGKEASSPAFQDFRRIIDTKKIPMVVIDEGDVVRYKDSAIFILGPDEKAFVNKEVNESSIVAMLSVNGTRALFTGDIGIKTEQEISSRYDIRADILKVAHHGSKHSSSAEFLSAVSPRFAFIGVGKNSYGHPTREAMSRIESVGARIFRTDLNGTLKIILGENISVFAEKIPVVQ